MLIAFDPYTGLMIVQPAFLECGMEANILLTDPGPQRNLIVHVILLLTSDNASFIHDATFCVTECI